MIAASKPHDFDDIQEQPWLRELHYLGPGDPTRRQGLDAHLHYLELDWPPSTQQFETAVSSLEAGWARALAMASADLWLELLRDFNFTAREIEDWRARIDRLAGQLDSPSASTSPQDDPVWRALTLSLWVAAADLDACLDWICSWLSLPESDIDAASKRVLATASAYALIRLYTAYPPVDSGTGRAPTLLFERLAEPLALQGSDGVDAVVRLVDHWLEDPGWADFLVGEAIEGRGRLERWAVQHLGDRPELTGRLSDRLAAVQPIDSAAQIWATLTAVFDRLRALRALEYPTSLPDLEEDQRYALLVFDAGAGDESLQAHLANVTANLYRELASDDDSQLHRLIPAVFRLGELRPFWAGAVHSPSVSRLLPQGMRMPGLIGPLLQALEDERDLIALLLLVTSAKPMDLDDWRETPWWSKVRLYGDGARAAVSSFGTVPEPLSLSARSEGHLDANFEAEQLRVHLCCEFGLGHFDPRGETETAGPRV